MSESLLTRPEVTERTTIPIFSAAELTAAAARSLELAGERLAAIEAVPLESVTAANILDAWDETSIAIEDAFGPVSLLNSVHPDKDVRDIADRALIDESVFLTALFQNERFYERVLRVEPQTPAQTQLRKDLLEAFEDSGVSLPPEKRERFRAISERLTELAQEFARNIRENQTVVRFPPEEWDGLPASYVERVPKDAEGNIVVGFDYPDYLPFMMNAVSEAARRRYYLANTNRGTARNLEIMDEIVALRREIASLYGVPSASWRR
jgi:thimet oligopeptidase